MDTNASLEPESEPELEPELEPEPEPELEPEPEPELEEPELGEPQLEEPEPESPPGPMAKLDEAAVLAWVACVPGLTAAQRAAALERMEEDDYDGEELAIAKAKSLLRLLRGTAAEGAVPRLLAARDAQLEAEEAVAEAQAVASVAAAVAAAAAAAAQQAAAVAVQPVQQAMAEPAERSSCAICMEAYSAAGGVVPRMLPCGHAFCEACLARMLRCANHALAPTMRANVGPSRTEPTEPCSTTTGVPVHISLRGWWADRCRRVGLGSGSSARRAGRSVWSRAGRW
jgi:hypothetical protein